MNRAVVFSAIGALACAFSSFAPAAPRISDPFASRYQISAATSVGDVSFPTQIEFGPDGRVYATSFMGETNSWAWNPAAGSLTGKQSAGVSGFGVAFAAHATPDFPTPRSYMYLVRNENYEGSITRLTDSNGNGVWGEVGEVNVQIVGGVPVGDHTFDQVQIHNNQLFVGIGARTNNGRTGPFTGQNMHDEKAGPAFGGFGQGGEGFTLGETSYNGAIGTIRNLTAVANVAGAAQLRDGLNGTSGNLLAGRDTFLPGSPHAHLPYTSTADDKLVVHSAGTRNPYGLAIDSAGALWFTNNFGRADSNGDGTSTPHPLDAFDSDLSNDVHDQFFRAVAGGDYGYDNQNFRGSPAFPDIPVQSTTFDNLFSSHPNFGDLHDPADPDGLGPSSSANGLDFGTLDLTGLLATDAREYAAISRWNGTIAETAPGTDSMTFQDVVVVDPQTGQVRRLAEGFENPIDVLSDGQGGFLIADFGPAGTIWRITPRVATSRWNRTGGGAWEDPASWTGPVPDAPNAVANFTGAITAPAAVSAGAPKVLGTISFDSINGYSIGGATLTMDVDAPEEAFAAINAIAGAHAISAGVHFADTTSVSVNAGATLTLTGDMSSTADVVLNRAGGGLLRARHLRVDTLVLTVGTTQVIAGGGDGGTSRVESLKFVGGDEPAATLDLADARMIVDYAGPSPIAGIIQRIAHARGGGGGSGGGGAWGGTGITSSLAAANPTTHSLGIAEAADVGATSFGGIALDGDAVLIRYTRLGDADLDGVTNINDFSRLAANFNQSAGWSRGDFNFDGLTNINDFSLMAVNFNQSLIVAPSRAGSVPEPTTALPATGLLPLLRRRRQK
jgi:hypothetical protein